MDFVAFRKQVKDALEHLYDAAYLETHPFLTHIADTPSAIRTTRAQKLRALLKDSVEQLRPQQDLPSRSPQWRSYLALRYRYVQGMSHGEIENELGISLRQLQRELHKGLEALALLLWEQRQAIAVDKANAQETGAVQELENELSQWTLARQSCDLHVLVEETLTTLQPMLESSGTQCKADVPASLPNVFVDAVLTRQVLIHILRLAMQQAPSRITLHAASQEKAVEIGVEYQGKAVNRSNENWGKAEVLCRQQGGTLDTNAAGQILLTLPRATQARVLVIDDNAAIQQLFERYLAPHQYEVIHAQDSQEALRLAAEMQPDAITLDVMMPRVDGWQILRTLTGNPTTAKIPVIVCSVLKEPEIALSLGARAYLKKPIERLRLVETLSRFLQPSAVAGAVPSPASEEG